MPKPLSPPGVGRAARGRARCSCGTMIPIRKCETMDGMPDWIDGAMDGIWLGCSASTPQPAQARPGNSGAIKPAAMTWRTSVHACVFALPLCAASRLWLRVCIRRWGRDCTAPWLLAFRRAASCTPPSWPTTLSGVIGARPPYAACALAGDITHRGRDLAAPALWPPPAPEGAFSRSLPASIDRIRR